MKTLVFSISLYDYIIENLPHLNPELRFDNNKTWIHPSGGPELIICHPSKDKFLSIIPRTTPNGSFIRSQIFFARGTKWPKNANHLTQVSYTIREFLK